LGLLIDWFPWRLAGGAIPVQKKKAEIKIPAQICVLYLQKPDQAFSLFFIRASPQKAPPNIMAVTPPSGAPTAKGAVVPPPFRTLTGAGGRFTGRT
jgi:hypothetical protein